MNANDEALLNDLLDGRLDEDATRDLEVRLTEEADLAAAWDELQQMRTLLRRPDPARAPAEFLAGVHRRLAADDGGSWDERTARALLARPRPDERPRWRLMVLPVSAAALLLIGLIVADRLGGRAPVEMARHGDELTHDAKSVDEFVLEPPTSETASKDARSTVEREASPAPAPDLAAERGVDRGAARGGPRPTIPGLAGGGERVSRLQPGGAVPAGLRTPSDRVLPDAFEPPSGDDASAPAVPTLVFALNAESLQNGTRSLASLLDERLEAGLDGTWRVVPLPTPTPKTAARPMAAAPSTLRLIPLEPTQLDPTMIEVAGRRVFDSMTLVLSPEQARRLGTFVRDKTSAPSGEASVDADAQSTRPGAPSEVTDEVEKAAARASRGRDSVRQEDAETDRAKAKREVRVRIWLVR